MFIYLLGQGFIIIFVYNSRWSIISNQIFPMKDVSRKQVDGNNIKL